MGGGREGREGWLCSGHLRRQMAQDGVEEFGRNIK
jgi:hypothetical protein